MGTTLSPMKMLRNLLLILVLNTSVSVAQLDAPPTTVGTASSEVVTVLEKDGHVRFLALLKETGLTSYFSKGRGTYLIPSEAYFESLTSQEYTLLKSKPEALEAALQLHTLSQVLPLAQLSKTKEVETVGGEFMDVEIVDDELVVGGLTVVRGDLKGNGFVIHVVDDFQADLDQDPLDMEEDV